MSSIMVQGTSSGAGKTTIAALFCRHFAKRGFKVAPFKASNLSLNSFVTPRGEEIGISQAYQAWACDREPEGDMNPILLKPKGNGGCQIILSGRPHGDLERGQRADREVLWEAARSSFRRLLETNDMVVIEGSGSPAEINLREQDLANMRTAEMAGAPVVLVGDIERGGVFAGLFGTHALLEERHRRLVKAFMINRFRGDESILDSGIARMEEMLGIPSLGVLPFADLKFPSEDSLDMGRDQGTRIRGVDIRKSWLANLDDLYTMSLDHLDYVLMEKIAFS